MKARVAAGEKAAQRAPKGCGWVVQPGLRNGWERESEPLCVTRPSVVVGRRRIQRQEEAAKYRIEMN